MTTARVNGTSSDAYERGEINARLAGHDQQMAGLGVALSSIVAEIRTLTLGVQRLGDQAVARDATVLTTAAALKEAEDARRTKSDQAWSPVSRFYATLGAIATLVGLLVLTGVIQPG